MTAIEAWAWLLLVVSLVACGVSPVVTEPKPTATPWCFAGTLLVEGKSHAAQACFDTAVLCGRAQRKALSIGGLAGIKEVSVCRAAR